jgi:FkbH-like protein
LSSSDTTGGDYLAALKSAQAVAAAETPTIRWAFLANTTQEPLLPFVSQACRAIGYGVDTWIGGYDTALQDATQPAVANADVVVVALRAGGLDRPLAYVSSLVERIRESSRAIVLVHSFETPLHPAVGVIDFRAPDGEVNAVRRVNLALAELASRLDNVFIVDLDSIRTRVGADRFVDRRMWHIGRIAYSRHAMAAIAGDYMRVVRAARGYAKKCLVADADGCLWGGIAGEDGVHGIQIGATFPGSAFREFQEVMLRLRDRGVLLALCSKNDPALVEEVFAARAADMPLRLDHFAAVRVNWTDKAQNIRDIAAELNIGLDSLVFVDDSAFEIALVKELLPMVETMQLPPDPVDYSELLAASPWFDTMAVSDDDRRRSEFYAAERQRRTAEASALSVDEYLRGLDMEVAIDHVTDATLARAAQLTQKTNQFNLTTKRYTESDVRAFVASADHDAFVVRLRDRLGDSGIVGVAIVEHRAGESTIDTLLMSCRVLGRGVEDALLAACAAAGSTRGHQRLAGRYLPTAKNGRVADFYASRGFEAGADGAFRRSIAADAIGFPTHFKTIAIDGAPVA